MPSWGVGSGGGGAGGGGGQEWQPPSPYLSASDIGSSYVAAGPSEPGNRPFKDVGKFQMNLVRPGDLINPRPSDAQGGFFKGLGGTLTSFLPGNQHQVGETVGGLIDTALSPLGALPNPLAPIATPVTWWLAPDSPEKRAAQLKMGDFFGDPIKYLGMMNEYAHTFQTEQFKNSLLAGFTFSGSMGDALNDAITAFAVPSRLIDRTFGANLSYIDEMLASNEKLPAQIQDLKDQYNAGLITKDQFRDNLVTQGFAWSKDMGQSTLISAATDPLNLIFGAGLIGKIGVGAKAATAVRYFAELAKVDTLVGGRGAEFVRIVDQAARDYSLLYRVPESEARSLLEGAERVVAEAKGPQVKQINSFLLDTAAKMAQSGELDHPELVQQALAGMSRSGRIANQPIVSETFGRIYSAAQKINDLNDPIRWFTQGPQRMLLSSAVNRSATEGMVHAIGDTNILNMRGDISKIIGAGGQTLDPTILDEGLGKAAVYERSLMVAHGVAADAVRTGGVPLDVNPMDVIRESMKGQLRSLATPMQGFIERRLRPLAVTGGGTAAREDAVALLRRDTVQRLQGMYPEADVADLTKMVDGLNERQMQGIDMAYFGHIGGTFHEALSKISQAEWDKWGKKFADLTLLGPRELTMQRARAMLRAIVNDDEQFVRDGTQSYDALFLNIFERDVGKEELFAKTKTILEGLVSSKNLPSEVNPKEWGAKVPQPLKDWRDTNVIDTGNKMGGYRVGFVPQNVLNDIGDTARLWGRQLDPVDGHITSVHPWVDVPGRSGGTTYVPSRFEAIKQNYLGSIRGDRIQFAAARRFEAYGSEKWGLPPNQSRALFTAINNKARDVGVTPRGLDEKQMWEAGKDLIPKDLRETLVGTRNVVDAYLYAYAGDLMTVGITQKFTGVLKREGALRGNFLGLVAEKIYPLVRFKFNPFFQLQELIEPWALNIMRGIKPVMRAGMGLDNKTLDQASMDLMMAVRGGEFFAGDNAEYSNLYLFGGKASHDALGPTTRMGKIAAKLPNIQAIKELNAAREFRKLTGSAMHESFDRMRPGYWAHLEREFGTSDEGLVAIRYMTERTAWAHDITDVVPHAEAVKPVWLGQKTPVHLGHLRSRLNQELGVTIRTDAELRQWVRNGRIHEADIREALGNINADPHYIDRAWRAANSQAPDDIYKGWEKLLPAGPETINPVTGKVIRGVTPKEQVSQMRQLFKQIARGMGMTEDEFFAHTGMQVPRLIDSTTGMVPEDAWLQTLKQHFDWRGMEMPDVHHPNVIEARQLMVGLLAEPVPQTRKMTERARAAEAVWSENHPDLHLGRGPDGPIGRGEAISRSPIHMPSYPSLQERTASLNERHIVSISEARTHFNKELLAPLGPTSYEDLAKASFNMLETHGLNKASEAAAWTDEMLPGFVGLSHALPDSMVRDLMSKGNRGAVTASQRNLLAAQMALGWAMTQERTGPTDGFQFLSRMMSDVAHGEAKSGKYDYGFATENLRKVIANGERASDRGMGSKKYDFADMIAGKNTRRAMLDDPRFGAPVAIDEWIPRSIGYVDDEYLRLLARKMNEDYMNWRHVGATVAAPWSGTATRWTADTLADQLGYLPRGRFTVNGKFDRAAYDAHLKANPGLMPVNGAQPTVRQTEFITKYFNGFADYLNQTQHLNRNDWTPARARDVAWLHIKEVLGSKAEGPGDVFFGRNANALLGTVPVTGSPRAAMLPAWESLAKPGEDLAAVQRKIAADVELHLKTKVADLTGVPIMPRTNRSQDLMNMGEPQFTWEMGGAPQDKQVALLTTAYLSQADHMVASQVLDKQVANLAKGESWALDIQMPWNVDPDEWSDAVNTIEFATLNGGHHMVTSTDGRVAARIILQSNAKSMNRAAFDKTVAQQLDDVARALDQFKGEPKPVPGYRLEYIMPGEEFLDGANGYTRTVPRHQFVIQVVGGSGQHEFDAGTINFVEHENGLTMHSRGSWIGRADQGKGIATWAYRDAERMTDRVMVPDIHRSDAGMALWSKRGGEGFGLPNFKANVVAVQEAKHDWRADPTGQGLLDRIRAAGRPDVADNLAGGSGDQTSAFIDAVYAHHAPDAYAANRAIKPDSASLQRRYSDAKLIGEQSYGLDTRQAMEDARQREGWLRADARARMVAAADPTYSQRKRAQYLREAQDLARQADREASDAEHYAERIKFGLQTSPSGKTIRGASWSDSDGRAFAGASKAADVSTGIHEMAHILGHYMDPSLQDQVHKLYLEAVQATPRLTRSETARLTNAELKLNVGRTSSRASMRAANRAKRAASLPTTGWDASTSEWFANNFVGWVQGGATKNTQPELENAFRFFAKTLTNIKDSVKPSKEMKGFFDSLGKINVNNSAHFNIDEQQFWSAGMEAMRYGEDQAFTTQFFKRDRSWVERSANHPFFGMYPISYMWGKVLPEMVKFLAFQPFGIDAPGWGISQANRIYTSIMAQKETDPGFRKLLADNEAIFRLTNMLLPATPWDIPVNAPMVYRRMAEAGLHNANLAPGQEPTAFNEYQTITDMLDYTFGPAVGFRTGGQLLGAIGSIPAQVLGGAGDYVAGPTGGTLDQQMQDAFDNYKP